MTPDINAIHTLLRASNWEDRQEFQELINWWNKRSLCGVCALIGIGGSGKTAIVDKFLQAILGVEKNDNLLFNRINKVLVYSFYEDNNSDNFLIKLDGFLTDIQDRKPKYGKNNKHENNEDELEIELRETRIERINRKLGYKQKALIILDGFEMMQSDNSIQAKFGEIKRTEISNLLKKTAHGYLPETYFIITTRFQIYDLIESQCKLFKVINVNSLEEQTCLNIFINRGIKSKHKSELLKISNALGLHALSIDLAASFIIEYCDSDPNLFHGISDTEINDTFVSLDPKIGQIQNQKNRFHRLAKRYFEALSEKNKDAWILLQKICLNRPGVGKSTLEIINKHSGDIKSFNFQLELLKRSILIDIQEEKISLHPIIRDSVLNQLSLSERKEAHYDIVDFINAELSAHPGMKEAPSNPVILDLFEELLYHTSEVGNKRDAYYIYEKRIGGYKNLGQTIYDFNRGLKICDNFLSYIENNISITDELYTDEKYNIICDWSNYNFNLGNLQQSLNGFLKAVSLASYLHSKADESSIYFNDLKKLNLQTFDNLILLGNPTLALNIIEKWPCINFWAKSSSEWKEYLYRRAFANMQLGNFSKTIHDLKGATEWSFESDQLSVNALFYYFEIYSTLKSFHLIRKDQIQLYHLTQTNRYLYDLHEHVNLIRQGVITKNNGIKEKLLSGQFSNKCDSIYFKKFYEIVICFQLFHDFLIEIRLEKLELAFNKIAELIMKLDKLILEFHDKGIHYLLIKCLLLRSKAKIYSLNLNAAEDDIEMFEKICVDFKSSEKRNIYGNKIFQLENMEANRLKFKISLLTSKNIQSINNQNSDSKFENEISKVNIKVVERFKLDIINIIGMNKKLKTENKKTIFISYSHQDKSWLEKFLKIIKPIERLNLISVWSDRSIQPGKEWEIEINEALNKTDVAILMVSKNFLASDYIQEYELPFLLNAVQNKGIKLFWMLIGTCLVDLTELSKFQAAHDISSPLNSLPPSKQDQILVDICKLILE